MAAWRLCEMATLGGVMNLAMRKQRFIWSFMASFKSHLLTRTYLY